MVDRTPLKFAKRLRAGELQAFANAGYVSTNTTV